MTTLTITSDKPVVVLEQQDYQELLDKIEDLEDLIEHEAAMKEYRETGGIDFDKFMDSLKGNK